MTDAEEHLPEIEHFWKTTPNNGVIPTSYNFHDGSQVARIADGSWIAVGPDEITSDGSLRVMVTA